MHEQGLYGRATLYLAPGAGIYGVLSTLDEMAARREAAALLGDVAELGAELGRPLRRYQLPVVRAICRSVLEGLGLTFVVAMPRQSGKNEVSAQLEAHLLDHYQERGGQMVKVAPTLRPQAANSMMRLAAYLDARPGRGRWRRPYPHAYQVGQARALFFSAQPGANVVGATADLLLECDEAQDVDPAKWDKEFAPMAASGNATRVFYGTMWTSRTLLARELRAAREAEAADGVQRAFLVPWEEVAAEVAPYGAYVRGEIARLGREHPLIRSQYLLQEIDEQAGMFPLSRQVQMRGEHLAEEAAQPGAVYALLLDVAGEDEEAEGEALRALQPRRDSTALTVVRVDQSSLSELGRPIYRVVRRRWWTGTKHPALYGALLDLARNVWRASYVVVDATGVGAGLASFLGRALGDRVIPFTFNRRTKSELGWGFTGVVDEGRFKDHVRVAGDEAQAQFWREVAACEAQVLPGPSQTMRWGVADPALHDDFLLSAALCYALEELPWRCESGGGVVAAGDVLGG